MYKNMTPKKEKKKKAVTPHLCVCFPTSVCVCARDRVLEYTARRCVRAVPYECEGGGEETEGEGCVEKGEIIGGRGGEREGGADDGSVDRFYF